MPRVSAPVAVALASSPVATGPPVPSPGRLSLQPLATSSVTRTASRRARQAGRVLVEQRTIRTLQVERRDTRRRPWLTRTARSLTPRCCALAARQAEAPRGDDVALDLARAAGDGRRDRPE